MRSFSIILLRTAASGYLRSWQEACRGWGSIEHFDIAGYAVRSPESLKVLVGRYEHYLGETSCAFVFESRNLFAGADAASDCRVEVLVIM